MTVSVSSSLAIGVGTAATTVQVVLPSVVSGDTIVLGIHNRSNETAAISGISDDVNGAWTLNYSSGPVDATNATARGWVAYRNNCGTGTTTITVTFDGAINSQCAACWIRSTAGAMTFEAAATDLQVNAATNWDSNTIVAGGAGAIIGFGLSSNAQSDPEPTADGVGESRVTPGQAGGRAFLFFETYTTSGTYGIESTWDVSSGIMFAASFLEAAAGGSKNLFVGKFGPLLAGKL